jgi:hypothetical protein
MFLGQKKNPNFFLDLILIKKFIKQSIMSWQQKINKIKKKVHMFCHVEIPCHTMHPGGKADNLEIARGKSKKKKNYTG